MKNTDFIIKNGVLQNYTGSEDNVVIPEGITKIGERAFEDCGFLQSVVIPHGVTEIGERAFNNCYMLEKVILPDSLEVIGDFAFCCCMTLMSISLPNRLRTIGDYAFWTCKRLVDISLPDSLRTIGTYAFAGTYLRSVRIPRGVTEIGILALDTDEIKLIEVDADNPVFSSDEHGVLYNKEKTKLLFYPKRSWNMAFDIPSGVTEIASHAFHQCFYLDSITIPDSVQIIRSDAFYTGAIRQITLSTGLKQIAKGTFVKCDRLRTVCYRGTEAQSRAIRIDKNNDKLEHADWIFKG